MDNPLKRQGLATLCTNGLKRSLCGWVVQGGQGKGGTIDREKQVDWVAKGGLRRLDQAFSHTSGVTWRESSWAGGEIPRETGLRRSAEEKPGGGVAVSVKESFNDGVTRLHLRPQAKGREVACHFFPGKRLLPDVDCAEVVKPNQHPVPPAQPPQNNRQPAGNEPGGHETLLVNTNRCTEEALLSPLSALKRQKQGPDHRTDRILKVGDQLDRQGGKGPSPLPAHKASNGDPFLPELREELNGIPPIGGDLSIAIRTIADGAKGSNGGRKINLTGEKRFPVFPKGFEFVKVGELNLSAPCSQGGRLLAAQTFRPASLLGLVIFPRSIPYLAHSPTLISSVRTPRKSFSPYRHIERGR